MENEVAATDKRAEARIYLMDAKSVAYLLAPCLLFTLVACLAVMDGTDYVTMPKEKVVVERHRKYAELRQIAAANIANGDPIPDRQTMLEQIDVLDERTKAWEDLLVGSGQGMRRMGLGVLIGVAIQFYVVFKLRAHINRLAVAGGHNAAIGSMPAETPRKFPIIFLAIGGAGAVALWLFLRNTPTESESSSATQTAPAYTNAHAELRAKYFTLTRNDTMPKPATSNEPWGVMMEIGYPKMVMTTVAFSDGTASVMRSSGGGFFGGGAIGPVKAAAEDFLKEARKPHPEMKPTHEFPQPGLGYVTFYLFTDNSILTWSGDGLDLEGPMTSLSRLRLTGERLLYEYMQLEKQKPKESPDKPGARPHLAPQNDTSL
jgi:hypothetical protein